MDTLSFDLARILSGKYRFVYNGKKYILKYPNIDLKYRSELFFNNQFEKNKYKSWITEDDILSYLIEFNLWTSNGDEELKKIEKSLDDIKVELYTNFWNENKAKMFKKQIANLNNMINKMYSIRHSMDHLTALGYASLLKSQYIFVHSLYDTRRKRIFKGFTNIDFYFLNSIYNHVNSKMIDIPTFKKIARSDNWKSYWSANKNNLFGTAAINWTDEQKTLVVLTRMYDNAYEHPDCPTDDVIEDDDAFDGWLISQKRETDKEKQKNKTEKLLKGKNLDKAGEVFVMASSNREANNIYDLNDIGSRNIIKERNAVIKNKKNVLETDLPDVKRNIVMQTNKNFLQGRKK